MKPHKRSCLMVEDDRYPCTCGHRTPQIVILNAEVYRNLHTGAIKVLDVDTGTVWYTGKGIQKWCRSQYASMVSHLGFHKMCSMKNFCGFAK